GPEPVARHLLHRGRSAVELPGGARRVPRAGRARLARATPGERAGHGDHQREGAGASGPAAEPRAAGQSWPPESPPEWSPPEPSRPEPSVRPESPWSPPDGVGANTPGAAPVVGVVSCSA